MGTRAILKSAMTKGGRTYRRKRKRVSGEPEARDKQERDLVALVEAKQRAREEKELADKQQHNDEVFTMLKTEEVEFENHREGVLKAFERTRQYRQTHSRS